MLINLVLETPNHVRIRRSKILPQILGSLVNLLLGSQNMDLWVEHNVTMSWLLQIKPTVPSNTDNWLLNPNELHELHLQYDKDELKEPVYNRFKKI